MQLQGEHAEILRWMAEQCGKPEEQVLAEILEEYFDDMRRDALLANHVLAAGNASVSLKEVARRHGLDNPL